MNDAVEGTVEHRKQIFALFQDIAHVLRSRYRWWQERRLYRLLDSLEGDSNLVAHVRREVPGGEDEMQDMMRDHVIRMAQLFSIEGHSGFSAPIAINILNRVLRFEPLGPLTGEDDEWTWIGYGPEMEYQNKRASHVFKRADGTAYDINGRIFCQPDGACYTGRGSCVEVTFPYNPTTEYVDVDYEEDEADGQ